MSNHVLVRLIRFISRFTVHLCNAIYFLTTFSTPCKWFKKNLHFALWDLNKARKQRGNDGGNACLRATGNMVEFLWAFWCIFWFGEVDEGEMVLSHGHFVNNFLVSHNIVHLFYFYVFFVPLAARHTDYSNDVVSIHYRNRLICRVSGAHSEATKAHGKDFAMHSPWQSSHGDQGWRQRPSLSCVWYIAHGKMSGTQQIMSIR